MATAMAGFLSKLRDRLADDSRPDSELVRDYVATRSEESFEELVRRFAPMVWGVCRRTVGHRQLAEDAFQATFLVFVRKSSSIRPPAAVGGWLHAVAVHTSLRARAMADRQRKRQQLLNAEIDPPVTPPTEPSEPHLLQLLDEEITKLPEGLRAAVVLCELEGMSRREAARRLGIAEGTLSSRLASARKQLAARLRSRGATLSLAALFSLLAQAPAAAAPPLLAATTSEFVSTLVEGAIRSMFLQTLARTAMILFAALTFGLVGLTAYPASAQVPATVMPQLCGLAPVPVPKPDTEGRIMVGINNEGKQRIEILNPKLELLATIPLEPFAAYHPTLSRDGQRVAVWQWDMMRTDAANRFPPGQKISHKGTLRVYDVKKPEKPLATLDDYRSSGMVFAPDGQSLYINETPEPDKANSLEEFTVFRFDLKTQKKTKLDLPKGYSVADISADGKTLLTNRFVKVKDEFRAVASLVPLDTLKPQDIGQSKSIRAFRLSPDGTRVLATKVADVQKPGTQELVIVTIKDGKETPVILEGETEVLWDVAWSRDGKKIAVSRQVPIELAQQPKVIPPLVAPPVGGAGAMPIVQFGVQLTKPEATIRNLDGSEPKPLVELPKNSSLIGLDWR